MRDLAPEPRIARAIDLAHAARTEPADDLIGTDAGAGWDVIDAAHRLAVMAPAAPSCLGRSRASHVERHEQRPDADGIAIGELDRRGDP